jgi:CheY-like chemotaxis protein
MTNGLTVLLVEDDHDVRVSVRSLLEDEGYVVLTVADGRSALELLQQRLPRPSLIILDLLLPLMDGWHVVARLRQNDELAQIPIVILSAWRELVPPPGAVGVLHKPFDAHALLQLVAEHCAEA